MSKIATLRKFRPAARPAQAVGASPAVKVMRVGYVPLLDAAPLLMADELGLFEKEGVRVELCRELGWGSVREKIAYGELDCAHAPGGLLFSLLFGTHAAPCKVATDCVLNLQGNGITLSRRLWAKGVRDGSTLKLMIRCEAPHKPVLAVVSPFSSHHYLLRKWLRDAGIDPDREVRIAVLPPPLVSEHMNTGHIDGFCVGEPWNSFSALAGDGWVVAASETLDPHHPEKVLVVRAELLSDSGGPYPAVRRALLAACRFCDDPRNREAVADLFLARKLFPGNREALLNGLGDSFAGGAGPLNLREPAISFCSADGNRATRERAEWFLEAAVETGCLRVDAAQRRLGLAAFHDSFTH